MRTTSLLTLFLACLFLSSNVYAANIYVDNTLGSDCTGGQYSVADRNCSGSDGKAYNTIQEAVNSATVGDVILMRGGIYNERNIDLGSKSGTAWTEGHYYKLASYPGEWAIIDASSSTESDEGITGLGASAGDPISAQSYTDPNSYWWFERFELRGAGRTGILLEKGPFRFRYLYIHSNGTQQDYNSLCGGIRINMARDTVIEYCRMADNGVNQSNTNNANIEIQSDYKDSDGNGDALNPSVCPKNNTFRYNYISGVGQGIRMKGDQRYGYNNRNPNDIFAYKDYGDKIHHNIILSNWAPIMYGEDFVQIYNNITDGTIGVSKWEDGAPILYNQCAYNNTVKGDESFWIRGAGNDNGYSTYYGAGVGHPHVWFYNNISSGTSNCYHCQPFMIAWDVQGNVNPPANEWSAADTVIENNLIHQAAHSDVFILGHNYDTGRWPDGSLYYQEKSVSEFNSHSATLRNIASVTNWDKDGTLFLGSSGADQYKTVPHFVLNGSTTVSNGGKGGNHPYLGGVTIPSYIGATNPDDSAWVDGVLGLANVANLVNGGTGDPGWIEGGGEDGTPPATYGHSPAKSATDVPPSAGIVVHVQDSGDGVDQSSIALTVHGQQVIPAISGDSGDYTINYIPPGDFGWGEVVTVTVEAKDLHSPANVMNTDSWSFTIAQEPDEVNPTVTITSPTSADTHSTEQNTMTLGGSASDNTTLTGVTWTNSLGGSGSASGTDTWTIPSISLQEGENVLSVTAHDAAGNAGADTLTVTYTPPAGTYTEEFGSATGTDYPGTLEDTFININEENSSAGEHLNTYTWPQDRIANAIIMKWDVSAIPISATIQDAKLYLYLSGMDGDGGDDLYDLSVHKIINYNSVITACTGYTYNGTNSWTPNSQCYNNVPMAQADIAPPEDTESINKTYGYKSWSVTNMVQDWVSSSSSNYGMLVNSDSAASSDSNRFFSATESLNPDQRPKLVVTYTVGEWPDTTYPTLTITSPVSQAAHSTEEDTVDLGGSASDDVGVTSVTWTNNRGGSGTALGTNSWTIPEIDLHCGEDNILTVTAQDAAGNSGADILTVDVKPCTPSGFNTQ